MAPESQSTGSRALGAGVWTVGSRLIAKSIDLVLLLCLARFLGPAEFGLVATAMAAVFVIEALFELPVAAALIRVPTLSPDLFHTAFTLGLIRGIVIALLLLIASIPLAKFNNEPRLVGLLAVLSLAPALRGLVSPCLVKYTRAFNFRPDAIMELSGKVVAFLVSISVAATTGSYWAIAAATVCAPMISTALSYVIAPLKPRLSLSRWKDFSNLVGWNLVAQLFGALSWQIDRLLLPRFTTNEDFGRYAMGKQLSEIPMQALITPLNRPTMAALSSAGDRRGPRYLQLSHAVALIMVPVLGMPLLWPEALVRIGLGTSWSSASEWLRWGSAVAFLGIPALLLSPLAMTLNRTRWLAFRTAIELFLRIPLVWTGVVFFGIHGAVGALAIATACGTIIAMFIVRMMIGINLVPQLMTLARPILAMLPAGLILWTAKSDISTNEDLASVLLHVLPLLCMCMVVYVLFAMLLWKWSGSPRGLEHHLINKINEKFAASKASRSKKSIDKKARGFEESIKRDN